MTAATSTELDTMAAALSVAQLSNVREAISGLVNGSLRGADVWEALDRDRASADFIMALAHELQPAPDLLIDSVIAGRVNQ